MVSCFGVVFGFRGWFTFHIFVASSCCQVGFVCLKLFFVSCQWCVHVVRRFCCVKLFWFVYETVSRLIEGCFVKHILELVQM